MQWSVQWTAGNVIYCGSCDELWPVWWPATPGDGFSSYMDEGS